MNTNLKIKVPAYKKHLEVNFFFLFFVVVLFACLNLAQTESLTAKDIVSYTADYCDEHPADSANEYDSGNDSDGIINEVSQCFNLFVKSDVEHVNFERLPNRNHLRPHSRAPPKVFI